MIIKGEDIITVAFAFLGFFGGEEQVFKADDLRVEVSVTFDGCHLLLV